MLKRRSGDELAQAWFTADVPARAMIRRRVKIGALQRSDGPVDSAFALTGNATECVLGGGRKACALRGQRTSQMGIGRSESAAFGIGEKDCRSESCTALPIPNRRPRSLATRAFYVRISS